MYNGILVFDKPRDCTSHDAVAKLRGILRQRKIGHAGTLDPMATGVLVVLLGNATRASDYAAAQTKEYIAGLRLGTVTDTQDITGKVLEERPCDVTPKQLVQTLRAFTGDISQLPPMYSAVSVGGVRLYKLARKGEEIERQARDIEIQDIELLSSEGLEHSLNVTCSKGTYIRTLCHDIGQVLGCGGAMSSLRRTMASGFAIAQAVTMDDVQERGADLLLPLDAYFGDLPAYRIPSAGRETRVRNGNPIADPSLADGRYRVYGRDGAFLCLSEARGGELTAVKNFFGK